ncbi:MAG: FHA domain-containing protein [Phycisphaerales bacterium]|nr:MAG: FHA domain-containing protein [Phycisphaerales bacterium]
MRHTSVRTPGESDNSVGDIDPLLLSIDRLICLSRLKEIEFIMNSDQADRVREIQTALRRLPPGQYLLGTGPSTVGIVPLNRREIVLGRPPTVLERPQQSVADYWATDTLYFVPREVSRAHVKIIAQPCPDGICHLLVDLGSTCGTFINQVRVNPDGPGVLLEHGDIVSLGPSRTSTYVYYDALLSADADDESRFLST